MVPLVLGQVPVRERQLRQLAGSQVRDRRAAVDRRTAVDGFAASVGAAAMERPPRTAAALAALIDFRLSSFMSCSSRSVLRIRDPSRGLSHVLSNSNARLRL
jgi:hypothetical protein